MATNTLAPIGWSFARNFLSGANTYNQQAATILNGYGTDIMMGDPVIITSGGVVNLAGTDNATGFYGIFAGVLPYYDTTLQAIAHGLNGAYVSSASPPTGVNIPCLVIQDPWATFAVQTNYAGAFQQSWVGKNCGWLAASIGNVSLYGNAAGRSGGYIDSTTLSPGTASTLPMRVVGPWGTTGSPQDPANNNPWIEVMCLNSAAFNSIGV